MPFKRRLLILLVSIAMIVSPVTSWAQSLGGPISPGTGTGLPSNPNLGTQLPSSGSGSTDTGHTANPGAIGNAANSPCASSSDSTGHGSTVNDSALGSGATGHTSNTGNLDNVASGATPATGHTDKVPTPTPTPTCPTNSTNGSANGSTSGSAAPTSSGVQSGSTFGPTEPPLKLEVPDCPGVVRTIDASHLPPSIYPKPTCGTTTASNSSSLGTATGQFGTSNNAPPAGTLWWIITGNKTIAVSQGFGMTDYAAGAGASLYTYCADYGVPGHCGVDIGASEGTPLYSPVAGKVVCVGTDNGPGGSDGSCAAFPYTIGTPGPNSGRFQVDLDNGDELIFGHMKQIDVTVGTVLTPGQYVGLSGGMNEAHVHVEYRQMNHPETSSGQKTLDPRDVFNVPATGVVPHGGPTAMANTPSQLALNPADNTKVLALTSPATTMDQFEQKYGFYKPTGSSGKDFAKYSTNFAAERDLAVKYAPDFNLDPQMVVWWTWAETAPPYDSYHYQNCEQMNPPLPLDQACGSTGYGGWQLGYGQQYAMGTDFGMDKVFQKTHGDPNDATLVQQVGQNVISKSGLSLTFPTMTVAQLMSNESANRLWLATLQRDQAISVVLLAAEIRQDLDGHSGETYGQIVMGWPGYDGSIWQAYSNVMNDVITNWGLAASATPGAGCTSSTTAPSGSCSSEPDSLQGMTDAEFTAKINANLADYKKIAQCADVPWQMMAAINMRETGLAHSYTGTGSGGALGPWQIDPTSPVYGTVDPNDFVAAGCAAAKGDLQDKAINGPVGRPLHQDMNPDNHDDMVSIKDAFFGYNGRGGWESNVPKGCTPAYDGHQDWNFDCSAYVMNNMDENHKDMCINGTFCDGQDGTWKVYYKLVHSTYGPDGSLLVYGGACNQTTGVVNGLAIPTAPNLNINSPFWVLQDDGHHHIGIDIANPEGAAVYAIADGDVVNSGWDDLGGYYILQHIPANTAGNTNERWVYYGHLDPAGLPAPGGTVKAGQQIAKTGPHMVTNPSGQLVTNGSQTGPHLHFDIRTTTSGAEDPTIHVNPCSIDLFKQSYPTMDCSTYGNLGASWK